MSELIQVKRWARLGDFNPLSTKQVKAYIRHKGYKMPKHRTNRDSNGERKDTTNDESLSEMLGENREAEGDVVLEGVLESRHLGKALSYLSERYVHRDGRLHPIFTMKPKQRLSSAAPNVMNFPKGKKGEVMKEAADAVLSSIVADEGFTLFSCDWNSLHPALIAFFADDPDYARIARLGDHAYVMSHYLALEGRLPAPVDLSRSDAEVKAELEALKAAHPGDYKQSKIANLAYKYLQGVANMAKTTGLSQDKVKKLRDAIDKASPKVAAWKRKMLDQAHYSGRLVSPFGLPLYFFDIYKTKGGKIELDKENRPKLGAEAPEAVAFMPLSTESGMLREVLVDLGTHEEHEKVFWLLIPEHDKVIGQIKDSEVDRVLRDLVVPNMNRAWPQLNGLRVGVDVETGKRLMDCGKKCEFKEAPVCENGHMKSWRG